jgi:hypothetical protein
MCPPHRRQGLYTRDCVALSAGPSRPYIGIVFGSRSRAAVTTAVVLEVGIAGWALGYGALWLLVMTVVVTVADTIWGVFQRRVPADIAGLEVGLALAVMVVFGADTFPEAITAAACFAWLIRDGRARPARAAGTR